jgi:hypothetical protein
MAQLLANAVTNKVHERGSGNTLNSILYGITVNADFIMYQKIKCVIINKDASSITRSLKWTKPASPASFAT